MAKPEGSKQLLGFALAGMSSMTSAGITNPIDVLKVRMQLDNELASGQGQVAGALRKRYYKGFFRGGMTIVRDEGIGGLYKGLTPSLMREASYSTIRIGAYEPLKRLLGATDPAHTPLWKKIVAGATSGAIGSAIATPTDLLKVRFQAEGRLKEGEKPRYKNTFSAFKEIWQTEGVKGLYVGMGPTVKRAAILTATQVPTYDHTKHTILNMGWMEEGIPLHVMSSMIAGLNAAFVTSPLDVIKTRMMNQKGKAVYKNSLDCFLKTLKSEGALGFYKGFFPNWMRIGPHTLITFFIFEQLRKFSGIAPV